MAHRESGRGQRQGGGDLVKKQRLSAALHYGVGQLARESGAASKTKFSKSVIATVAQLAFEQIKQVAEDCEAFSKHAKRSTVQAEDVKLCVRRNPKLHAHITKLAAENSSVGAAAATASHSNAAAATAESRKRKITQPLPEGTNVEVNSATGAGIKKAKKK